MRGEQAEIVTVTSTTDEWLKLLLNLQHPTDQICGQSMSADALFVKH